MDGETYPQRQVKQVSVLQVIVNYQHSEKTEGSVLTKVSEIWESESLLAELVSFWIEQTKYPGNNRPTDMNHVGKCHKLKTTVIFKQFKRTQEKFS